VLAAVLVTATPTGATGPSVPAPAVPTTTDPGASAPPGPSNPYLLVEGVEIVSEDREIGIPPAYLVAQLDVPNTTYPSAWELSGYSSTGDRYLVWAAYNYSYAGIGCPAAGYSMGYEVETSTGASDGAQCVPSFTPSVGDAIDLELDLACGGTVGDLCLVLGDLTLAENYTPSVSQPTPTATYFQNDNPSAPSSYGYFTGVETIVDDPLASSGCLDFPGMPTVSYSLQGSLPASGPSGGFLGLNLSSYQVFASETDPVPSVCASYLSPVEAVPASIETDYYQGGGAGDGSHWMSEQNWTSVARGPSMGRFQSDVAPVNASLGLSQSTAEDGQVVAATLTASGGVGPYTCAWSVDGSTLAASACSVNLTVSGTGPENVSGFAIDANRDDGLAWAELTAYAGPSVGTPVAAPSVIDAGQSTAFTAAASGGAGGFAYAWSGLPAPGDCSATTGPRITCSAPDVGTFDVVVTATDTNGFAAVSPPLAYTVNPDPSVTLAIASGGRSSLDVGQATTIEATVSGGTGPFSYVWSTLPGGCTGSAGTATCRPSTPGRVLVSVTVTDATGGSASSTPFALPVSALPSVSLSATRPTLTTGTNVTIQATVLGGAGGFRYFWSGFPPGCSAPTGPTFNCTPTQSGTYEILLNVTDANGGTGNATVGLDVRAPSSSGFSLGGSSVWWLLAALGVVAAVGILIFRTRRRGRPRYARWRPVPASELDRGPPTGP